jgi:hypothetical protein
MLNVNKKKGIIMGKGSGGKGNNNQKSLKRI